jgi:hypothetical protein
MQERLKMDFITQADCDNDLGAIVTLGMVISGERAAMVFPMGCPEFGSDGDQLCASAVTAFDESFVDLICACIATDCYVDFIQADGMVDGNIPSRLVYSPTDKPGLYPGNAGAQQVAALITMYKTGHGDASTDRQRMAHNFLPGIASSRWSGGVLDSGTVTTIHAAFNALLFTGVTDSGRGETWFRYLSTPFTVVANPDPPPATIKTRPGGKHLEKIGAWDIRRYPATQKRRLLPRP